MDVVRGCRRIAAKISLGSPSFVARCVALAAVCAACKACLLPMPGRLGDVAGWCVRWALVSTSDVAFCAALSCFLYAGRRIVERFVPSDWRVAEVVTTSAMLTTALFAVAAVPIFLTLNVQLSYPLLSFVGGWRELSQSFVAALTPAATTAVLLLPATLHLTAVGIDAAARQVLRARSTRARRACATACVTVVAVYVGVGGRWVDAHWNERSLWQTRIARSPHWSFLSSLWRAPPPLPEAAELNLVDDELQPKPSAKHPGPTGSPPTNVVLLVLESVGANYLHAFGGEHDNTPELRRLADRAWFFDAAYAQCPSSAKALVALLSGTYPRPDFVEQTRRPTADLPGIAACVRSRGYRTGFIHSGNWSWRGGEDYVRAAGFEHFQDARNLPLQAGSWGTGDDWLLTEALRWIDAGREPFLLTLWTIETHHPYHCAEPERDFGVADPELNRYLNAVAAADRRIGELWRELERRGLAESTVVVITGDHGQAFGTHGQRLHIFGLYEENVRVPLVVLHDGKRLPVGRSSQVVEHVDLAPTIAQLCGVDDGPAWQGRSLLEPQAPSRAYFYTVWDPVLFGLRDGAFKYIVELGGGVRLFHLPSDPGEHVDLSAAHPEHLAEFRRRVNVLRAYQHEYLARLERGETPTRR